MTLEQTLDVLELLSGAYPEREISEPVIVASALAWAEADAGFIRGAALAYIRSGERFPPRPGDLLKHVDELDAPTPEEGWGEVRGAIRDVGHLGTPEWSHPLIGLAVHAALGPWSNFCKGAHISEMVSHRARFIDAYRGIESRDRMRDQLEDAKSIAAGFPVLEGIDGIGRLQGDAGHDEGPPA